MSEDAPPKTVFVLRSSPHLKDPASTNVIMRNVVYALLPVSAFSVYSFGWSALLLILVSTASCVLTEHLFCKLAKKTTTVSDWSAVITGILLALTLPPGFPLWMAAVGGFVSIALGKTLFGSLGYNIFNPALVGRAFLQATFPTAITTWFPAMAPGRFTGVILGTLTVPFMQPGTELPLPIPSMALDGWAGATPLSLLKFEGKATAVTDLFAGMTAGSAGETCAVLILVCGAYLAIRKMMDWRITAAVLGSAVLFSGVFYLMDSDKYPSPLFMLCSGGLMLGAVFMATDMVTSPTTPLGVWIFGALIGFVTVIIRLKGGLPEGVMYAILLANAVSPLIERVTQPRVFGTTRRKAAES